MEAKENKSCGLVIVTGSYGSGKTEYAVNLARQAGLEGRAVTLVDLDVVNPYFRSRDMRERFASDGIEVVAPEGGFSHADLPMLSPRVKGAVKRTDRDVILDVGGDPMGARVLGRFAKDILRRDYDMVLVANTRRPDTRTAEEISAMINAIEAASGLVVGRIVANAHLMDETTPEVVLEGAKVAQQEAGQRGIVFSGTLILEDLAPRLEGRMPDGPVFAMKKTMKKPWEADPGAYRC